MDLRKEIDTICLYIYEYTESFFEIDVDQLLDGFSLIIVKRKKDFLFTNFITNYASFILIFGKLIISTGYTTRKTLLSLIVGTLFFGF